MAQSAWRIVILAAVMGLATTATRAGAQCMPVGPLPVGGETVNVCIGAPNENCTTVCASHGPAYTCIDGDQPILGSGDPSGANCIFAAAAFSEPFGGVDNACGIPIGCQRDVPSGNVWACTDPTTSCAEADPTSARYCVCAVVPAGAPAMSPTALGAGIALLLGIAGVSIARRRRSKHSPGSL